MILDSIDDVPAREWDELTFGNVYGQRGWLRALTCGTTSGRKPRYFLLFEGKRLAAAAIGYHVERADAPSELDELLLGRIARSAVRTGLGSSAYLHVGPVIGYGRYVYWRGDGEEAARRIHALLDRLETYADHARFTVAYARIPADETLLLDALRSRGLAETLGWPIACLDVPWSTFEEYVGSLADRGRSLTTKVRREAAAPAKHNVQVQRAAGLARLAAPICRVLGSTHARHSKAPFEVDENVIAALEHAPGTVVTVAARGEELVGAALLLASGPVASGPLIGVSEDAVNRKAFTYFNLAFYEPIRYCIERGIRRVHFGPLLLDMKRKRGCFELDTAVFLRPATRAGRLAWRSWLVLHRRWMRRKLARQMRAPR